MPLSIMRVISKKKNPQKKISYPIATYSPSKVAKS